jgi:hypothetical protein
VGYLVDKAKVEKGFSEYFGLALTAAFHYGFTSYFKLSTTMQAKYLKAITSRFKKAMPS